MNTIEKEGLVFIRGKRVILRPILEKDFTLEYLEWLNDPAINEFSQKRPRPSGWDDMKKYNNYYLQNPREGFVLAIIERSDNVHIGNVALVNIQPVHRCAEPTILIGNRNYWNKGYGSECIYILTKHGFTQLNLNKIFAGSFNPAFVRCVEKIGWKKEGEFRERIWSNDRYHNQVWMSILRSEFRILETYEDKQ
ncbi:MAG: GNAT family protein [Syntrophales bacterium]|jgi:RimJ/RimL family protein N-acetyltransferase